MRKFRVRINTKRQERRRELLPPLPHFGDHLTPAVLLSINTGMRRGEILALRWESIDFDRQLLTVEGAVAKTRQTRHVFLNEEAMSVLNQWREQSVDIQRVFPMSTGFQTAWESLLRRAKIVRFRWHDMRHHFAPSLVQIGVPLNTVRDLLGHALVAMSHDMRIWRLTSDARRSRNFQPSDLPHPRSAHGGTLIRTHNRSPIDLPLRL